MLQGAGLTQEEAKPIKPILRICGSHGLLAGGQALDLK
jgi:hypothetical protein